MLPSLKPSLSRAFLFLVECHWVSVWGLSDRRGLLPVRRTAAHHPGQHRACARVRENPLQILQVRAKNGQVWPTTLPPFLKSPYTVYVFFIVLQDSPLKVKQNKELNHRYIMPHSFIPVIKTRRIENVRSETICGSEWLGDPVWVSVCKLCDMCGNCVYVCTMCGMCR